ncbi:hypothetical protein NUW58_g7459 [Xylaria curta]|uniref:Uncharacterized protein n=1 Tax=Xylaria curta TaxID=42375 RepID=A0ACC1NHL5_9PEZI|nr:hypothetical protein NUW58_g7459 [Xylaria curta]
MRVRDCGYAFALIWASGGGIPEVGNPGKVDVQFVRVGVRGDDGAVTVIVTELRESTEFEACKDPDDTILTGLATMPSLDGGKGNSDGDGDMGVGFAVVGTTVLVGDDVVVFGPTHNDAGISLVAAMGSISTTHFSEEKSGVGTRGEPPVFGTLDLHFSGSGVPSPATDCEDCRGRG